jgi:hypothetical protein
VYLVWFLGRDLFRVERLPEATIKLYYYTWLFLTVFTYTSAALNFSLSTKELAGNGIKKFPHLLISLPSTASSCARIRLLEFSFNSSAPSSAHASSCYVMTGTPDAKTPLQLSSNFNLNRARRQSPAITTRTRVAVGCACGRRL